MIFCFCASHEPVYSFLKSRQKGRRSRLGPGTTSTGLHGERRRPRDVVERQVLVRLHGSQQSLRTRGVRLAGAQPLRPAGGSSARARVVLAVAVVGVRLPAVLVVTARRGVHRRGAPQRLAHLRLRLLELRVEALRRLARGAAAHALRLRVQRLRRGPPPRV